MNTRRKFIFNCSTVAAALALAPVTAFKTASENHVSSAALNREELMAHVGSVFRTQLTTGQYVDLTLLKVRTVPATPVVAGKRLPDDHGFEKFSLVFRGPQEVALDSAIHQFQHTRLGKIAMHLGPIGMAEADDRRYEAVFNQPAPTV